MAKKIANLNCLVRPGENAGHDVVLLHGFGADSRDLQPLADVLDPQGHWNFYFPEGPHDVPIGPMMTGKAWFPISIRALEEGIDFTQYCPPGLMESAQLVEELVFHLNSKKLILGGFSQGAMLATQVALSDPQSVGGLLLFSGALLDEVNWTRLASGLAGKPFVQSHGNQDAVIRVEFGEKLNHVLRAGGAEGNLVRFNGGHEIPMAVILKAREFLTDIRTRCP